MPPGSPAGRAACGGRIVLSESDAGVGFSLQSLPLWCGGRGVGSPREATDNETRGGRAMRTGVRFSYGNFVSVF